MKRDHHMIRMECEQEDDGRWLVEVMDVPGVLAYGATREEAAVRALALYTQAIADL